METDHQKQLPLPKRKTSIVLESDLLDDIEAFAREHNMSVEEVFQCANRMFLKEKSGLLNPISSDDDSKIQH